MIFKKSLTAFIVFAIPLSACDREPAGITSATYSGDYRSDSGIGEFFNCKDHVKYFVKKNKTAKELEERYLLLGLKAKEDVFVTIEGFFQEEKPEIDGINPATLFVPTRIISLDKNRGCDIGARQGS